MSHEQLMFVAQSTEPKIIKRRKMKKLLVTISMVVALSFNLNAQSDSFFSYSDVDNRDEMAVVPGMPPRGSDVNNPAPIGSGLILLAGMGVAYALRKKD